MLMDGKSFDPSVIGTAARALRARAGLTQAELAERAGLAFETISRVESGREPPSLRTAMSLADALGTTLDEVVGRANEFPPEVARRGGGDSAEIKRLVGAARRLDPKLIHPLTAIVAALVQPPKATRRRRSR